MAVALRSRGVPADVALELLEGDLGADVGRCLQDIPVDVAVGEPAADHHLGVGSPATVAWDLLEERPGMDELITTTLLGRKRPRLIPVYDRVVRCAFGRPAGLWDWALDTFADGDLRIHDRLLAVREAADVSDAVSALRVLDVVVWMRHQPVHLENGCPGLL